MLPWECILGKEEKFQSFISTLDHQFDIYAEHGITLAYHHHNWEYLTLSSGKSRMHELLTKTEKIRFVHDTFWTAKCGFAPDEQIREFGSRLIGIHLRDLTFYKYWIEVLATDCPVGKGIIHFDRVLAAAKDSGCEYLVIEQNSTNPYKDVRTSYEHLSSLQSKE
jgi:sugar phosphate isomerase/epimerase